MSFPTSADLTAMSEFLRLQQVQRLIEAKEPAVRGAVSCENGRMLTITMPPLGADPRPRVALGRARTGTTVNWLLTASTGSTIVTSWWDQSTSDDVLADAAIAMRERCVTGTVASPWCWAEPERTTVVRLAERLRDRGYRVEAVVSHNRLTSATFDVEGESVTHVPRAFGDALRVSTAWGSAMVSRKPTLGWVLDASDGLVTRRRDLSLHTGASPATSPGLHTDDVAELAEVVARAIDLGCWEPHEGHHELESFAFDDWPIHQAAAWWMRELGYPFAEARSSFDDLRFESTAAVEIRTSDATMSLGDIQRVFAKAVADGRKPIVFMAGFLTRDAGRWADKANVAVFHVSDDYALRALTAHAVEHMPVVL